MITATHALCPYVSTTLGERKSLLLSNMHVTNRRSGFESLSQFCCDAGWELERLPVAELHPVDDPDDSIVRALTNDVIGNMLARYFRGVQRELGDARSWAISLDENSVHITDRFSVCWSTNAQDCSWKLEKGLNDELYILISRY